MSNKKVIEKFASILNDFSQTKSDAVSIEASQFEELEHNFYWHLKHELGEKFIIGLINQMCEESLSPILFEKWEEVKSQLEINRQKLKKD